MRSQRSGKSKVSPKIYLIPRFESESPLEKFRASPLYQRMIAKKRAKLQAGTRAESLIPLQGTDRAHCMVEYVASGGNISDLDRTVTDENPSVTDAICATLIKAGFDQHLVEVLVRGDSIVVYIDGRAKNRLKSFQQSLASIGEVTLLRHPLEVPELGTFIYAIKPHADLDPHVMLAAISDVKESVEAPKLRSGDIVLDKASRGSVRVLRVLSNNRTEVQDVRTGKVQVVDSGPYETGLVSGRLIRIVRESDDDVFSPFPIKG